jgi:hypothetical protein
MPFFRAQLVSRGWMWGRSWLEGVSLARRRALDLFLSVRGLNLVFLIYD